MSSSGVRFAPSPTGIFHVGNLRTAWVSSEIAKAIGQPWVVRVEDIDTARVRIDAWASQRSDLNSLGLEIESLQIQSEHHTRHLKVFERARAEGRVYPCDCSRREVLARLANMASAPHSTESEYSGHCRDREATLTKFHPKETLAWRWKCADKSGRRDAIVARSAPDGSLFSPGYHWACSVDDAFGKYHVIVRAWDLDAADLIQREIRNWLLKGAHEPVVFHTALVTQNDGHRLEKRTQGVTLAEVLARGISVKSLIEKFASSFDLSMALESIREARRPAGEIEKSVTLSRLSL